jgi:hypothetical protein
MIPITKTFSLALITTVVSASAALAYPQSNVISVVRDERGRPLAVVDNNPVLPQNAPTLQGATMGTIDPQGTDATVITGLMTAGTVRVNNLANLEAALNILAMFALVVGHILGIVYLIKTVRLTVKTPGRVLGGLAKGFSFISIGLLSPQFINWAVGMARDAAFFN